MICLNPILKSPWLSAIVAGSGVMLYFTLMSYSPNLPPAVICSLAVAYFVYFMMGGKILCDEEPESPSTSASSTLRYLDPPDAIATVATADLGQKHISAYQL